MASSQRFELVYSTFESKHGHSICDGHFGVGKKKIRRDINNETSSRKWTVEFVVKTFGSIKNTIVHRFQSLEEHVFGQESVNLPKRPISKQRCFHYKSGEMFFYHFTPLNL